jgi:AcrR family transcriptional regulator
MSSKNSQRDTRGAILDAARALFETQGYFGTGLESVAKGAGVSRQAIYLHYASKADLLQALHQRVNEQDVAPAFRPVWAAADARAALDAWVEACARAIPKILAIANALNTARRFDPDVEATWEAPKEGQYAQCLRLARWLRRENQLIADMTATEAADILWSLTALWSYEGLVHDRRWSVAQWRRWVTTTLHQLLLGDTAPARGRRAPTRPAEPGSAGRARADR